jgi:elongation factor P
MYETKDFRKNLKVEIQGEPYVILEAVHVKPGKGVAFVKTRIKSLISGRVLDINYRSGDKVGKPDLVELTMQYLYFDGEGYVFMDNNNFEQITLKPEALEDVLPYMKENESVSVLFFNGEPINVDLPNFVYLRVTQTDPGFKGDTATGATKPATMETGLVIQVPLYLEEGETIKIDTRDGRYVERVKV